MAQSKNLFRISSLLSESLAMVTEKVIRRGNALSKCGDERYGSCRSTAMVEVEREMRNEF